MIIFENPAAFGEALYAFFPKSLIPKRGSVLETLEKLARHQNPRHAEMANRLLAICRRYDLPEPRLQHVIQSSSDVYRHYLEPVDESAADKTTILLFAKNRKLDGLAVTPYRLSEESILCGRHVMQAAIENRSKSVIVVQYFRDGEHFPTNDRSMWHELIDCAEIFDVRVLDYLIIGKGGYYSVGYQTMFNPDRPDSPAPKSYW